MSRQPDSGADRSGTLAEIPVDAYGADDGDLAYVPHVTRSKALGMMASFWGADFPKLRARRCYLRHATQEERRQYGWDQGGYGICVMTCEKGTPGAVPGWLVDGSLA